MPINYKAIDHILIDSNMKQKDLLKKAGICRSSIAKLKKGKVVRTDIIEKICIALNKQPGDIMKIDSVGENNEKQEK